MHARLGQRADRARRRDEHARRARGAHRVRVAAREVDRVELAERVPRQRVGARGHDPLAEHGDRALGVVVEERERAPLRARPRGRRGRSRRALAQLAPAPLGVVARRRARSGRPPRPPAGAAARRPPRRRRRARQNALRAWTISPASGTRATRANSHPLDVADDADARRRASRRLSRHGSDAAGPGLAHLREALAAAPPNGDRPLDLAARRVRRRLLAACACSRSSAGSARRGSGRVSGAG